ncbi:biopolymer transporter ExbD [Blastopirellula sp. JC732]|uniref:Biopolymer transporter ExbD n=1 Tax=Blastopirellula sediminis TaxID=2894196 RepID=A0A9X1MTG0_9BACT|nr:biopolymer transporter ExbD [Blastopirellula sediminis]MCC9604938.1 biopolymer transporter ExbD [Blastopirellula sediminis]MCC9631762.1 biopolymer transporter ExbD [Blastopirellula sediminis]
MKLRNSARHAGSDKIDLQMTPMIDIVFQLLVFFVMTFKVAAMEGDFDIKMPKAAQGAPSDQLPLKLTLRATPTGKLDEVRLGDRSFSGLSYQEKFKKLQDQIIEQIGTDTGPGSAAEEAEIEIDADYNLQYEYVIEAMTAVTGRVDKEGNIQRLIEKVKFSPSAGR